MPVTANTVDTMANWVRSRDPNLDAAHIVELLNQGNEMVPLIPWAEGNQPFGNQTSIRIGLPTIGTRQIGQAAGMSSTREAQFNDGMAILEAWNEVDMVLARAWGDVNTYRYNKLLGYMEAMTQTWSNLFWYGDTSVDPTQFYGLTPRYSTVNTANAASAKNVIDCGGTGSVNTSVWLLTLGEHATCGIFPRGTPAGLMHKDWGEQVSTVTAGYPSNVLAVYRDQYTWTGGIKVADWRWNVRLCNIDVSNLANESGATDLLTKMLLAVNQLPSGGNPAYTTGNPTSSFAPPGGTCFVMNRTARAYLAVQTTRRLNPQLTWETVDGRKIMHFMGYPIYLSDQITNTEAQVT